MAKGVVRYGLIIAIGIGVGIAAWTLGGRYTINFPSAYPGDPNGEAVYVYIESPAISDSNMSTSVSWIPYYAPWYWANTGTKLYMVLRGGSKYEISPYIPNYGMGYSQFSRPGKIPLDLRNVKGGEVLLIRIHTDRTYEVVRNP